MTKEGSNLQGLMGQTSRKILHYLLDPEKNQTSVKDICLHTGLGQSQSSHILSMLRHEGVVKSQRRGKNVYYKLTSPELVMTIRQLETQAKQVKRRHSNES